MDWFSKTAVSRAFPNMSWSPLQKKLTQPLISHPSCPPFLSMVRVHHIYLQWCGYTFLPLFNGAFSCQMDMVLLLVAATSHREDSSPLLSERCSRLPFFSPPKYPKFFFFSFYPPLWLPPSPSWIERWMFLQNQRYALQKALCIFPELIPRDCSPWKF